MNPFQLIPPTVRKWLYLAYAVVTLALLAVTAYVGAIGEPLPDVVIGIGAALVPVGTALGFTAAANTSSGVELTAFKGEIGTVTIPLTLTADDVRRPEPTLPDPGRPGERLT